MLKWSKTGSFALEVSTVLHILEQVFRVLFTRSILSPFLTMVILLASLLFLTSFSTVSQMYMVLEGNGPSAENI